MKPQPLGPCLGRLQAQAPLTICITNFVTITDCANALLAIGASPVMSNDPADAAGIAAFAPAAVLNMGTLNSERLELFLACGAAAKKAGHPVVFDPVGVGATAVRREAASRIINEVKPDVVRGNFSEIQALAGLVTDAQKGVDSAAGDVAAFAGAARAVAAATGAVVAVTGPSDVVALPGGEAWAVEGGSPMLPRLTGTGCMLTAMTGGYAGANPADLPAALTAALAHMALAGERAAREVIATQLGTFHQKLFDALAAVTPADLDGFPGVREL